MNFSFGIQRDVGQGVLVDIAYVRSLAGTCWNERI